MIFVSHGEVERVALKTPCEVSQFGSMKSDAGNLSPVQVPALDSFTRMVRGSTGRVTSTESAAFSDPVEATSKRTVALERSWPTFAAKRTTAGASLSALSSKRSGPVSERLVMHRTTSFSFGANFWRATARSSISSPSRRKRGRAGSIINFLETSNVSESAPNWLFGVCARAMTRKRVRLSGAAASKDTRPFASVFKFGLQKRSGLKSLRVNSILPNASSPPSPTV